MTATSVHSIRVQGGVPFTIRGAAWCAFLDTDVRRKRGYYQARPRWGQNRTTGVCLLKADQAKSIGGCSPRARAEAEPALVKGMVWKWRGGLARTARVLTCVRARAGWDRISGAG
jgi:hypothetical protein